MPEPRNSIPGRDHAGRLLTVMNGALVGVPSAYAVSHSLAVTALAAGLAVASAVVLLAGQRPPWRCTPGRRRVLNSRQAAAHWPSSAHDDR